MIWRRVSSSKPARTRLGAMLDEALADGVRHRVGAVAELEARRDVVDDVLDRPLRVEEAVRDLGGVEAVGEQPDHGRLALRQPGEGQPARREDLALELAHLPQQAAEQVRWEGAFAGGR